MRIVIIGAGVMGLSCAYRLAQEGNRPGSPPLEICVLESRAAGRGASTAALGALWPASPLVKGPLQLLHRQSLARFECFAREISQATGLPVTYRRGGRFEFLSGSHAIARAKKEASASPDLDFLDESQAASLLPGPGLSRPALHCRATAQVNVHELLAALRAACVHTGIIIREHTPAQSLEHSAEKVTAVQTATDSLPADLVLIAAGAWSAQLLASPVLPIRPVKGQGIALRRPHGLNFSAILKSGPIYLVPWDDEIWVGSTTEPEAGFDESPTPAAREALLAGAAAILPALKDAPVLRHWAGLRPQNPARGHTPFMGPHPTLNNVFLCTAHFKTGIGMAPAASQLVARSLLQGRLAPELMPFRPCF